MLQALRHRPNREGNNSMTIQLKRAYEKPERADGTRILVDRLWPRGLTKEKAAVDLWLKEIAPTTELRKWFNHEPKKWAGFRTRYDKELRTHQDQIEQIIRAAKDGTVTLVYAARDESHNEAIVLRDLLAAMR